MSYDVVKQELSNQFSVFADNYNIALKKGYYMVDEYIFFEAGALYEVLNRQRGDETKDTLVKADIQKLIVEFNAITDSTVSTDYE